MKKVVDTKSPQFIITKINAAFGFMLPFGISLTAAVLSFALSMSRSMYLLKAMAALLAKTMHRTTFKRSIPSKLKVEYSIAKKYPINAKGNAKMVWLNFISDR